MRPTTIFWNGQSTRAGLLPTHLTGYDALILSEAFDDDVRKELLKHLQAEYPHVSSVVGEDRGFDQDGGVLVVSRWPIVREAQCTFGSTSSGDDRHSDKGVLFVALEGAERRLNIFATHAQASSGKPTREEEFVRKQQFSIIRSFIDAQAIPNTEAVVIAGDLNVDMYGAAPEYHAMLRTLGAVHPAVRGHRYSYDSLVNDLASGNTQELLDYILYSSRHLEASSSHNEVMMPRHAPGWREFPWEPLYHDLSDHFPVSAELRF